MTAVAPAPEPPAREQTAPLPQPTPADVVALQAVQAYPAVSVLCATEPAARMSRADAARLAALVADAADRLTAEFGAGPAAPTVRRLRELAADLLTPATDVDHPDVIDDAVDEVIETVLRRGGWVALAEDGALADRDRIALTTHDR